MRQGTGQAEGPAGLAAREIPCLSGWPVLGNLLELQKDRFRLMHRVRDELGPVGAIRLGPRRVYVLTCPDMAREILMEKASAFEKGPMLRSFARPFLGEGVINCLNRQHSRKRRLTAKAFTRARTEGHAEMMARLSLETCQDWQSGDSVDLFDEMRKLTLRVIGLALFSLDLTDEAAGLGRALDVAMDHISHRLDSPWSSPLFIPTRRNRRVQEAVQFIDTFIGRLIRERRDGGDRGDVLSLLMSRDEGKQSLSDAEVLDEVKSLFFAGFETNTTALSFAWAFLADNSVWAARVRSEVDAVVGDREPTASDLPRLPLTLAVIKESLRIYPPVHSLGRQASRDVTVGGYRFSRGALLLVSPYLMHRRREVFPDPERFEPERFAPGASPPGKFDYLPFGAGPRVCLGAHFAMNEAQIALATLAKRFSFHLAQTPEPQMAMTLRPRGGVPVSVSCPPPGAILTGDRLETPR